LEVERGWNGADGEDADRARLAAPHDHRPRLRQFFSFPSNSQNLERLRGADREDSASAVQMLVKEFGSNVVARRGVAG
jgi:hypothetical protein